MINYDFKADEVIVQTWSDKPQSIGGMTTGKILTGIKATHIPTGICVVCDEYRSQYKNREAALIALWDKVKDKPNNNDLLLALNNLAIAYRTVVGLDGAYDDCLVKAEKLLKKWGV